MIILNKRWLLRRLAVALNAGHRKTRIKSLAAELCLEQSVVLELLRYPSLSLLSMNVTLLDEPAQVGMILEAGTAPTDIAPHETIADVKDPESCPTEEAPLHVTQQRLV